jgi:CBS-domain-containing membrane protein
MRTRDVMSSPVVTIPPHAHLKDVAAILVEHGIKAVPVVDDHDRLLEIVSEADLLALEAESAPGSGRALSPAGVGPPGLRVTGDSRSARFTVGTRGPAVPLPQSRLRPG